MTKELRELDTAALIRVLDNKMFSKKEDDAPQFTERQVLHELDRRDLSGLSQRDEVLISFARSRDELFEKDRDRFKTREMSVVELLKKLFEYSMDDFYRSRYIKELEIRQEEGELTPEQQLTFEQLQNDIKEMRREAVEQIKKGMKEFVEGVEGMGEKLN